MTKMGTFLGGPGMLFSSLSVRFQVMTDLTKGISCRTNRTRSISVTYLRARLCRMTRNPACDRGVSGQDRIAAEFPLTQEDLAAQLGAYHVSVGRALKELKKLGRPLFSSTFIGTFPATARKLVSRYKRLRGASRIR